MAASVDTPAEAGTGAPVLTRPGASRRPRGAPRRAAQPLAVAREVAARAPAWVVIAFLWVGFLAVTVAAFVAILATGRYPRALFAFNVGVLRWTWRVSYYATVALGTDRYPPFTLARTDYPAELDVPYPERLSRGKALVKWWLLALPHYAVLAAFLGTWNQAVVIEGFRLPFPGLVAVLTLVAGVVLLFTGRYPRDVFALVVGIARWTLRVIAYAALMRDDYPPFRLRP